jgi:catechol 2,3-dioxygenase-like lactoylglutathione lyase family enzyme
VVLRGRAPASSRSASDDGASRSDSGRACVVLLFDRERSLTQHEPPHHGASGSIHAAFLAGPGEYDAWKERLAERGVALVDEIACDSGVRSCYFNDPAGNLLEIAEHDLWTE